MKKYYLLEKSESKKEANLTIFGDITSFPVRKSDVSNFNLSEQLQGLDGVDCINVYISSYGGEVAEGLAIYNALKRHKAKVKTFCDGFACSIASVVFMAGDERIMNESSLLMIHNAWTFAEGNAAQLRKQADDLEKITEASVKAYKAHSSLDEDEIKNLMDNETWILPEEALTYGFATSIEKTEKATAKQNALHQLFEIIKAHQEELTDDEEPEENPDDEGQEDPGEENPATENPDEDPGEDPTDEELVEEETEDEDPVEDPEENPDDEPGEDESDEDDSEDENTENATQKWSGFFNALLK